MNPIIAPSGRNAQQSPPHCNATEMIPSVPLDHLTNHTSCKTPEYEALSDAQKCDRRLDSRKMLVLQPIV